MKLIPITSALALAAMATTAQAQTVIHYWDFESTAEWSGIPTAAVGTPDLSIHATYGEAYTGSGQSLNTVFDVQSYLIGDVHDGTNATAMDFATGDFALSYWSYNDTSDGSTRGPRIFDVLDGTTTGVQLATNASNIYNLRVDTDDGGATLSNNTLTTLEQPADNWTHIAVNVDRTVGQLEIFFDGVSQGLVPMSSPSAGGVYATRDMDIGVINTDGTQNQVESAGLDDLAFYEGMLSAADIAGLASGTLTPLDFGPEPGTGYCFGDGSGTQCPCGNNSDGTVPGSGCANGVSASGAKLTASGDASLSNDTLVLYGTGLDPLNSGLYFQANDDLSPGIIWGDGLQCAGGQLKRLGVRFSDATGASDTSAWTTPISVWAGNVLAGDTKRYQLWYRDTSGGQPCGVGVNDFNSTNGYEITWTP